MGNSTITLQDVVYDAMTDSQCEPVLSISGRSQAPALSIASTCMNFMLSQPFPWKWNELAPGVGIPLFCSNSYQQDYAVPGLTNLAWLQRGRVLDVNNTSLPKPSFIVEVGRSLPQLSSTSLTTCYLNNPQFIANWFPNDQLYYGVWGGNPAGSGNDPVAGSVYTNPISPGNSQPSNPITQIRDANSNLLVLTTYGTTGMSAPVLAVNSAPGTTVADGSCVWTAVDPKGQGFRIAPVPSQGGNQWQFWLVGQARPPRFTSLSQTLDPIPDDYAEYFRQGFFAYCYMRSPEAKTRQLGTQQFELWKAGLADARQKSDRERDECGFVPDAPLIGGCGTGYLGAAWPYPYPVPGTGGW